MPTNKDPIEIHTRVFPGDDGKFRFRIDWWIGDVDTRNTPPTHFFESPNSFAQRPTAVRRAAAFAAGIGAGQKSK